jgi:hypothetical protein
LTTGLGESVKFVAAARVDALGPERQATLWISCVSSLPQLGRAAEVP